MTVNIANLEEAKSRVKELLDADERVILGVVGAPGAGKSTLAQLLAEAFAEGVPGDGAEFLDAAVHGGARPARDGADFAARHRTMRA